MIIVNVVSAYGDRAPHTASEQPENTFRLQLSAVDATAVYYHTLPFSPHLRAARAAFPTAVGQ